MRAKTIFRNSTPRLYSRLARQRKILRLLGKIRNGDFDLGSIIDVIEKSRGMYNAECPLCGAGSTGHCNIASEREGWL
jgi:hypothetical protein